MEIPVTRWYPAITKRHAQRQYDAAKTVGSDILDSLRQTCREFRPFPGARVELVTGSADKVFKGILGPINKVKGASAYLVFIGKPDAKVALGYTGEGIILEATSLGLGTCWISQTFRPEIAGAAVKLEIGEKVAAVSPVGYIAAPNDTERVHKRKPLDQLAFGVPAINWPEWVRPALEAACLAPSAYNRQPWKFRVEEDAVMVETESNTDKGFSPMLDCGITMLHLELGARQNGVTGKWEIETPPQIARYRV